MNEYTVIYFPIELYHNYKAKLENIINKHGLKWNEMKVVNLSPNDIMSVYTVFGHKDVIIRNLYLRNRNGNSGIWQTENCFLKGVFFEKGEHLPVLIIHKGAEDLFYDEFIKYCVGIGCTISVVSENNGRFEEVFEKRKLDSEKIFRFINAEGTKDVMKEIFLNRINSMSYVFDSAFIVKWKELIEEHGRYNERLLHDEIQNSHKNKQRTENDQHCKG